MFGEFIQCNKHGGEGMRHDEKYGYWCELCELGYPRSEGQPNTGLQADECPACGSPEFIFVWKRSDRQKFCTNCGTRR